jgi:peptide-methionine (S)-S-oxide reductase
MSLALLALLAIGCADAAPRSSAPPPSADDHAPAPIPPLGPDQAEAILAGGCFWCLESDFDKLEGVLHTTSGYAGGHTPDPTYARIGRGDTGHAEVVRVVYDTRKLDYAQVIDWFLRHVDPTDAGGQFCDRGSQYRSAIFPVDEAQRAVAQKALDDLSASGVLPGPVATRVEPTAPFTAAENYHQDFHDTNPARYYPYRLGCGRDARVAAVWAAAK